MIPLTVHTSTGEDVVYVIVEMNGNRYGGVAATHAEALRLAKVAAAEDIPAVTA